MIILQLNDLCTYGTVQVKTSKWVLFEFKLADFSIHLRQVSKLFSFGSYLHTFKIFCCLSELKVQLMKDSVSVTFCQYLAPPTLALPLHLLVLRTGQWIIYKDKKNKILSIL